MKFGFPVQSSDDEPYLRVAAQFAELLAPCGRIILAMIFFLPALGYFMGNGTFDQIYAGLSLAPANEFLLSVFMLLSSLSIAIGYFARVGAAVLVALLVPLTFWMHPFWLEVEPAAKQLAEAFFLRNLAIVGGALLLAYFGAGPMSADERHAFGE